MYERAEIQKFDTTKRKQRNVLNAKSQHRDDNPRRKGTANRTAKRDWR